MNGADPAVGRRGPAGEARDVLRDLAALLDPDVGSGAGDVGSGAGDVALAAPEDRAGAEDPRFVLLVGLFDEILEAACRGLPPEAERRALAEALGAVEALIPVLRFELQALGERFRQDDLTARMREREIRMHEGWLLPRLRRDLDLYERRIRALRAALGEAG